MCRTHVCRGCKEAQERRCAGRTYVVGARKHRNDDVQDARMSWVQGSTGTTMCRTHVCRGCKEAQERRCAGRTYAVGARMHRNDDVQDARMCKKGDVKGIPI